MRRTIAILFLTVAVAAAASAQMPASRVSEQNGFRILIFETTNGQLRLYLPDDIRQGDTISGSVVSTSKTSGSMSTYEIVAPGARANVSSAFLRLNVSPTAVTLPVRVVDPSGVEAAALTIPVLPSQRGVAIGMELPRWGQIGRPLEIAGQFDGDFATTRVRIGEKPVAFIAESPRKLLLALTQGTPGMTSLSVTENGRLRTTDFRGVKVQLSAPKTSLVKGETTTLTMQLDGLLGMVKELPVDLVTTGSVSTEGGNSQYLRIAPSQVQPDGRVMVLKTLTAVENGSFNVTATVINRRTH